MASDFRCLLLSPENALFDEFIFSIKFCEIFQGFTKKIPGLFQGFQGFKNFPGFSRISRARTSPVYSIICYLHIAKAEKCFSNLIFRCYFEVRLLFIGRQKLLESLVTPRVEAVGNGFGLARSAVFVGQCTRSGKYVSDNVSISEHIWHLLLSVSHRLCRPSIAKIKPGRSLHRLVKAHCLL